MDRPLVSVLLPVYNCAVYIEDALQSVLNQTYTHFECIVIDDCSTDETVAKIKAFNDTRIRLEVKSKNSGYTNSLNYGLTLAKGKYIARMDGDDISLPQRFEKQVKVFEADASIVACGTVFKVLGEDTIIQAPEHHEAIRNQLLIESCIGHPTVMLRKATLEKHAIRYDTTYEPAEDYNLWTRLAAVGKLYNLQEVLFEYRIHEGQVSTQRREKQRHNASKSRFDMLCQIGFNYSEAEKQAYIKQFSFQERLTFTELLVLLAFKERVLSKNSGCFDAEIVSQFFNTREHININQYFKANRNYHLGMIKEYRQIAKMGKTNFTIREVIKLYLKAVCGVKTKNV